MWRRSPSTRLLIWTLVLTVLAVRASDTHLHLCFDGQEPPTTVHFADASVHHDDHHQDQDHADKDVDPFVGALVKSDDTDSHLALVAGALILLIGLPVVSDVLPIPPDLPHPTARSPSHLRPPLRGPPA